MTHQDQHPTDVFASSSTLGESGLLGARDVLSPTSGQTFAPASNDAASVINLDQFRGDNRFAGVDGAGYTVVVLDTGIDLNHQAFGPDTNNDGVSDRIVYHQDFTGEGDGTADDVHGHGTHVSSIIGSSNPAYEGIAPEANIISLQVLGNNGSGSIFDIEDALQWVNANADTYNIVAVNMSLGGNSNLNFNQTHPLLGDEFQQLADQDIVTTVAAGNGYYDFQTEGVSSIAADPNVIPVGAVWDGNNGGIAWSSGATDFTTGADRITSFSQRSDDIDMVFAPGALITGAAPGGGARLAGGTSQATPVVTGMAVLAQQLADENLGRRLSNEEFETLLTDSSTQIFDGDDEDDNVANTNTIYDRVDMLALAEAIIDLGDQDDFGESEGTAGEVEVGGSVGGDIEQSGDRDWFAVELDAGTSYRFSLRGESSDGGTLSDGLLKLREADGTELASNNNSGVGTDARLGFTANASGTYYLEAAGSGGAAGTYTLETNIWSVAPPPPPFGEDDHGNDGRTATSFGVGERITGTVEQVGDHDWFAIDLEEGTDYRFALRGASSDRGTLIDPLLQLRDIQGNLIAQNNNSGVGNDARLAFEADQTGLYFLDASAVGSHTGTYTLEAREWRTSPDPAGAEPVVFASQWEEDEELSASLDLIDL